MENYKFVDGKRISCGFIIYNDEGSILAGHPTGKGYAKECYDLFKGCANEGEEDFDCAVRELREESGFNILKKCYLKKIKDLGIFEYNKEKLIHLYSLKIYRFPNLRKLKCTSYYEYNGKILPEMNSYRIIKKNERYLFYKGIQFVLNKIMEI